MSNITTNIRFWSLILLLLLLGGILLSPVSADAPYYLSVARDIRNGLIPYHDINVGYTPLVMYLNSVLWQNGPPPYLIFTIFQYGIILLSAFLLYRISIGLGLEKQKSVFLAIFFSIGVLSSEGNYINLEVYSVLFMLLAYLLLQHKKYFAAGIILALSFFSKQYGLLNFVPFVLLVYFTEPNGFKSLLKFCLGGILPLAIFLFYFSGLNKIPVADLIFELTGQGYENNIAETKSVLTYINGAKIFVLMAVPLLLLKFRPMKNRVQLILCVGMLVSLLPVLVQNFQHYFINAMPYLALLIAMNWKEREFSWIPVQITLVIVSGLLFLRLQRYTTSQQEQKQIASAMAKIYPPGSEVYLKGQVNYLYVLNNYSNPQLKEAGYSYAYKPSPEFIKTHTVISFENLKYAVPQRIMTINGKKIYEY